MKILKTIDDLKQLVEIQNQEGYPFCHIDIYKDDVHIHNMHFEKATKLPRGIKSLYLDRCSSKNPLHIQRDIEKLTINIGNFEELPRFTSGFESLILKELTLTGFVNDYQLLDLLRQCASNRVKIEKIIISNCDFKLELTDLNNFLKIYKLQNVDIQYCNFDRKSKI